MGFDYANNAGRVAHRVLPASPGGKYNRSMRGFKFFTEIPPGGLFTDGPEQTGDKAGGCAHHNRRAGGCIQMPRHGQPGADGDHAQQRGHGHHLLWAAGVALGGKS